MGDRVTGQTFAEKEAVFHELLQVSLFHPQEPANVADKETEEQKVRSSGI